jgi:pimeloyl-ACP methyl ester carboxylesterase
MGDKDPDFPDPANEAEWIAERLNAKVLIVPGAGHYPQVEFPTVVGGPIAQFCTTAAAA